MYKACVISQRLLGVIIGLVMAFVTFCGSVIPVASSRFVNTTHYFPSNSAPLLFISIIATAKP